MSVAAILAFARSPLGKGLGLGLLILALVAGIYLKGRSDSAAKWRPKVEEARQQLSLCQKNRETLDKALKRQNAAVDVMKAEGARLAKATDEAVREAEKRRAASDARAGRLEALARTFGKGNACTEMEAADAALLRELAR